MATCPTCSTVVDGEAQFCPRDGTPLGPSVAADPYVGRVLGGRYRLTEPLGQGGMGRVYRAVHLLMDKPVALKVLRGDLSSDPEAVARFHREARSASRLDHEHCIRVTDFGQTPEHEGGLLYLVMELLEGESLSAVVTRGAVPAPRAARLALEVASALTHAHELGIIHRDLKPDNVFLVRRGRRESVKVLDFGLAKLAGDAAAGPAITKAGVVFGTPQYMAPEQAEGGDVDVRTDLYSLGVLTYQMVTGDLPFRAPSFVELLTKQVTEPPVPPRQRRPDLEIPEALEAAILRCMAKSPADRFQSAAEFLEAMQPLAEVADPSGQVHLSRRTPSGVAALSSSGGAIAVDGGESLLSGEVVAPPRSVGRRVAIFATLGLCAVGALGVGLLKMRNTVAPSPPAVQPARPDSLAEARRLIENEDLDGADRILTAERKAHDGPALQELMGELALLRGNRLGALAHYHRATQLAPEQAEPHARLASLLALLGQRDAACQEARSALARDGKNAMAKATQSTARCP